MSKFSFDEDDFSLDKKAKKVSDKSDANEVVEEQSVSQNVVTQPSGMTGTRGRKGQKLPTMNMRFSVENYEYMRREGRARGMTATSFVNWLIETYRSNPAHVTYNNAFKDTEGWDD